jgi:DNA-directed RNA polymerase specialized sigma subunit
MKIEIENASLIRKLAWSFHKSTGVDYKELFSEACLAYYESLRSFNPMKGCKKTTHAWTVISNQLCDFVKREKQEPHHVSPFTLLDYLTKKQEYGISATADEIESYISHSRKKMPPLPDELVTRQPISFEEWIEGLPVECQEIARVIVEHANEIPENLPPKMTRGVVVTLLREEGFSWPYILKGMSALRLVIHG